MKKLLSFCLAGILMTGVAFATGDPDMQTVTSKRYVINELDKLQDKIPGTSGTKAVTLTGSRGGIEPTEVKESLGSSNSDPALPNVGAVNTGLATKQNEIPAVNTNTVVTYTGTAGQIGQKGIYQDTGTYAAQSDNLIDAGTFNESLRNGLNSEFICAGYAPGGECWLWNIRNQGAVGVNLYDPVTNPMEQGTISSATGQNAISSHRIRTSGYINVEPNTQYTISESGLNYIDTYQYDSNGNLLRDSGWRTSPYTFTTNANTNKIRVILADGQLNETAPNVTPADLEWLQVEPGNTASEHLPYTTLVPAGYTPLEYIESDGTQMINTGISGLNTGDWEIYVKWMATGNPTGPYAYVCGAYESEAANAYRIITVVSSPNSYYVSGNSKAGDSPQVSAVMNAIHEGIIHNGYVIVDGVRYNTTSQGTPISSDKTIWLFGRGAGTTSLFRGRIYGAYAKRGNTLMYNYIPARRDSDNAVGMYDTVSGTFFPSAAAGTNFEPGPAINNNVYIPQGQQ